MGLRGWGADPEDRRFEVEVTNLKTGDVRTFTFETPVGAAAVSMRKAVDALDEHASLGEHYAVQLRHCVPELADEPVEAVQALLALTGGALGSPLVAGTIRAVAGKSDADAPGWGGPGGCPFLVQREAGLDPGRLGPMDMAAWEAHFRAFPPVVAVEIVRLWRDSTEGLAAHLAHRFPWAFELVGLDGVAACRRARGDAGPRRRPVR